MLTSPAFSVFAQRLLRRVREQAEQDLRDEGKPLTDVNIAFATDTRLKTFADWLVAMFVGYDPVDMRSFPQEATNDELKKQDDTKEKAECHRSKQKTAAAACQ